MGSKGTSTNSDVRRRLRDCGITIGSYPTGRFNAITDVKGVRVGQVTLRSGNGALKPGKGPVRTGVTAIIPHDGDLWNERATASAFVLNGNGEVTGLHWVKEAGFIEGPILLTNTMNIPNVSNGAISWMVNRYPGIGVDSDTYLPVVGECDDSSLNDAQGRHVKERHVRQALDQAVSGAVAEGAVGAGAGMICYEWKGGIGTSSRKLPRSEGGFTVGVLVNCNHGDREELRIKGVEVGRMIGEDVSTTHQEGSICIIVATDAPLNPLQLERVAKRACLGLARTGANAHNESGDFVVAFSSSRRVKREYSRKVVSMREVSIGEINPIFRAVADATEEAVLNAIFMAETTVGRDGNVAYGFPIERCLKLLNVRSN
jgi:D-aminopeptidase